MFETVETICIAWFTIEFLIRLWASPEKIKFLKNPLNIIDILSIVPFYLSIALGFFSASISRQTESITKLFTLFRVLRILRIFKLARHSQGLKQFGKTIKMSVNELGILFMFLAIAVLLFSSLAYFAEKDQENTPYTSIPAAFW
jgi:potassium voltage-gated channel Shab-related subfamily B protein 1